MTEAFSFQWALFGLPRKKSAGKSHRPPLHYFLKIKISSVDEYVSKSSEIRELQSMFVINKLPVTVSHTDLK